jgi:hypothetical protein
MFERKLNYSKGFKRIWIVFSVMWIMFFSLIKADDIKNSYRYYYDYDAYKTEKATDSCIIFHNNANIYAIRNRIDTKQSISEHNIYEPKSLEEIEIQRIESTKESQEDHIMCSPTIISGYGGASKNYDDIELCLAKRRDQRRINEIEMHRKIAEDKKNEIKQNEMAQIQQCIQSYKPELDLKWAIVIFLPPTIGVFILKYLNKSLSV